MNDDNVTWEPVEHAHIPTRSAAGPWPATVITTDDTIAIEASPDGLYSAVLPPTVRLCRAVAVSKSCPRCGEILSRMTCPHCGSHVGICDQCDHTEPCRATQVAEAPPATWSQEPPDGWVWFVGTINPEREDGIIYRYEDEPVALYVRWGEVYWSVRDYDNGESACSVSDCQGYWLPASVPQPSGEV